MTIAQQWGTIMISLTCFHISLLLLGVSFFRDSQSAIIIPETGVNTPMLNPASDGLLSLSAFIVDEIGGCQLSGQPLNNPSGFDAHVNDALGRCG